MLIGRYDFACTMQGDAILPPYKGSTFRGALGSALKKAVCVARRQECSACLLSSRCVYAQTFESGSHVSGSPIKASPPVPYVIEPPLNSQTYFSAGNPFDFSLLLFGKANESLPYFIYAFEIMGESGIGKKLKDGRGRFTLDNVKNNGITIYDFSTKKLKAPVIADINIEQPAGNIECSSITLKLLTPLRLKHNNTFSTELPFHILLRTMLRRISGLFKYFGDGEPPLDYRGIIADAQKAVIESSSLRWHDWERYSNRQEMAMMMGGLIGSVTYSGSLEQYIPLFKLCRDLHIGKQSSFGLGLFDYEPVLTGAEL
ncbi:MAG: CRISPR system precrRNA processing endoribonuclease RAMP protein Cas6 [Desulfuromonadaceae bacterium]|nr:CRISPR system precrRNA processing endoribonuclease RAMP protein Cas6 [Desulfuromonadaceae bacterium]MDD2856896.1 CRISPR system precrRNA processing endoribonuclease RAMP protein Cas6 [Desulfuromonadaceae bacterium]